jgi:formylmethanofuran dehydrogenase subunit C
MNELKPLPGVRPLAPPNLLVVSPGGVVHGAKMSEDEVVVAGQAQYRAPYEMRGGQPNVISGELSHAVL